MTCGRLEGPAAGLGQRVWVGCCLLVSLLGLVPLVPCWCHPGEGTGYSELLLAGLPFGRYRALRRAPHTGCSSSAFSSIIHVPKPHMGWCVLEFFMRNNLYSNFSSSSNSLSFPLCKHSRSQSQRWEGGWVEKNVRREELHRPWTSDFPRQGSSALSRSGIHHVVVCLLVGLLHWHWTPSGLGASLTPLCIPALTRASETGQTLNKFMCSQWVVMHFTGGDAIGKKWRQHPCKHHLKASVGRRVLVWQVQISGFFVPFTYIWPLMVWTFFLKKVFNIQSCKLYIVHACMGSSPVWMVFHTCFSLSRANNSSPFGDPVIRKEALF